MPLVNTLKRIDKGVKMLYLKQGNIKERIDKLIDFKYKADVNLVLYWHYLTIKDKLLEDIKRGLDNDRV